MNSLKEIGEAQQLVASHLALLERAGIVGSNVEASPFGPNRRSYYLKQSGYISLSFGPNLFNTQLLDFQTLPQRLSGEAVDFMNRIKSIEKSGAEHKIEPFSGLLKDIDGKLSELDNEKAVLLFIRNLAMKHVTEVLQKEKSHDERRVLHYILDERTTDIQSISEALNLKESIVRGMLEKLKQDLP